MASNHEANMENIENYVPKAEHKDAANLTIKIVNTVRMDPIIKKVMTMRILEPLKTGKERTHLSIALELGIKVGEVHDIETAGLMILEKHLQKVSVIEGVEEFNRDRTVTNAVKNEIGKSTIVEV